MKYFVDIGKERLEVDLDGETARIGGVSRPVHLSDVEGTPVHLVGIGGRVHRVVARRLPERGRYTLRFDGWRFDVEALDERTRVIRDLTAEQAAHAGPLPVTAPMPGMIVRVHVQPGDTVTQGQGVISMEAMKMENELRAATAGTVKAVLVKPGQAVEKSAVLVELI
ncbi:MAG TPA: biotin/lipoyl-containing protein [Gemmatimonadaceae bacterium]